MSGAAHTQGAADLDVDGIGIVPPQTETVDAAQLLTWVAFRQSLSLSDWSGNIYPVSRQWPFDAACFFELDKRPCFIHGMCGPRLLLRALEEGAVLENWRELLPSGSPGTDLDMDVFFKKYAQDAFQLLPDLKHDIELALQVTSKLLQANAQIRQVLEAGSIHATGRRFKNGKMKRTKILPEEWIIGSVIWPNSRMTIDFEVIAEDLLFDLSEVMSVWSPEWPIGVPPVVVKVGSRQEEHQKPIADLAPQSPAVKGKGGRPPWHGWDLFWIEVALYAAKNDLELDRRQELQRHMSDWMTRWEDAPGESAIRSKIAGLFNAVKATARN